MSYFRLIISTIMNIMTHLVELDRLIHLLLLDQSQMRIMQFFLEAQVPSASG